MKLGISRYQPPTGRGRPLTAKSVRDQLKQAGVTLPPIPGAAERAVELLRQGKTFQKVVLVRGTPPREPGNAVIVPEGDARLPVFPGQIVARKLPPSQGEPGRTIDGRVLKPKSTTKVKMQDLNVQAGENTRYDAAEKTFTAEIYGMMAIEGDRVHVVPGLVPSEDLTRLEGVVHHRDHLGQPIVPERFAPELERLGVALPLNEESVNKALERARAERKLQREVPVVQGREARDGDDGWLELLVGTHEQRQAAADDGGGEESGEPEPARIDYRERGALPTAEQGELVARLHPPEPGEAGMDIYARPIPAHGGKPLSIVAGENVEALEDGTYRARDVGLVVVERGVLTVTQLLIIHGDLDMAKGNVRAEIGSVRVCGMVQSGMTVVAPKHIVVDDTVESATLQAGEDISVGGGLLMPDGGEITAGGHVAASFASNARIRAGGDAVFRDNITNCRIEVAGRVVATRGKGIVQGGEVITGEGVEVKELGSDLGVATTVSVHIPQQVDRDTVITRRKLKRELARVADAIGQGDPREILERTPPKDRRKVAEIIKIRMKLMKKLAAVDEYIRSQAEDRQKRLSAARIKVHRSIHPGVTIKLGGRVLTTTRRIDRSQIHWHAAERRIVIGQLGQAEG